MDQPRQLFLTKTVLIKLAVTIIASLYSPAKEFIRSNPEIYLALDFLLTAGVRRITKGEATIKPTFETLIVLLSLAYLLTGCQTVSQPLSTSKFYRRDMYINVNGQDFTGVGVPSLAANYYVTIQTSNKLNLFTATSCHRQIVGQDVGSREIFGGDKTTYKFLYTPDLQMEAEDSCPLQMTGSQDSNEHSWGFLEFITPGEKLGATIYCNGVVEDTLGVSVCQSKMGLVQKIVFQEPVIISPDTVCPLKNSDSESFEYEIQKGRCTYIFATKDGLFHRHTTLGYEEVLVHP